MYESLLLPWSSPALTTSAEHAYRAAGCLRTKGTIFLLPPPVSTLRAAYNAPPRAKTRMSAGAVALCKHFERGGASSEHGRAHPFWTLPRGSNEEKTEIAGNVLERMLSEAVWRNVMLLHAGVAVYEVRNHRGFGMRWTLDLEEERQEQRGQDDRCMQIAEREEKDEPEATDVNSTVMAQREGVETTTQQECSARNSDGQIDTNDTNQQSWRIVKTTFRGFLEPIEAMDHELGPV